MEFDLENPLTNFNDFCPATTIPSLFLVESDHMPTENYIKTLKARDLDISLRREVISSISQFSCKFDPFLSYLAVNYLDRFLSSQGIPQPKTWVLRLVAISCVSLAAKMKKTEFSLADLQSNGGFIFDAQTVERMEYLILGALKWRMRSITPFSFISFFISSFELKDPPLRHALKTRAVEIIFKAQMDHIKLLEFKPSIIAASALLSASHELFPLQFPCFRKAISSCSYVNKENMFKCYNSMQETAKEGYESMFDMFRSSNTPVNVLDQKFSWSESETTNGIVTTATTITLRTERDIKRRKSNDYRNKSNGPPFSGPTLLMTVDHKFSSTVHLSFQ
ncbi:putative cyclin-D6-1 [Durio zibethinus]|uniref:Cyclin-D6-1 n=1 Tax=Durio zibethinus TaxID=66656 RepID=A0A6P5XE63_DURZI|nr:putative cyclin-D6-1 [Durio zibethinus]